MQALTISQASAIIDAALHKAHQEKFQPLTVAVLDAGGHLLALKREDGSSILRPQIAHAKAWGVLGMGHGGRGLAERALAAPAFFSALTDISGGRIVPVAGGVLIRDAIGNNVGAIGISGDHPDNDELCAIHGITQVGLHAVTD
ncbi:GlcG/HbpS family heme-binding protein [Cupriavidus sp. TMH.W2]|uniref:GlcG/HbpS family heme-binding protein n=1 Tax=Cupriavidus sp. TMH.W2 TaxID=3434465 RepID=UPI003D77CFF1